MKKISQLLTFIAIFIGIPFATYASTLNVAQGGTGWGQPGGLKNGYVLFGRDLNPIGTSTNLFWDNTNNRLKINADPAIPTAPATLSIIEGSDLAPEMNVTDLSNGATLFNLSGDTDNNNFLGQLGPNSLNLTVDSSNNFFTFTGGEINQNAGGATTIINDTTGLLSSIIDFASNGMVQSSIEGVAGGLIDVAGSAGANLSGGGLHTTSMGDTTDSGNGAEISIDDAAEQIHVTAGAGTETTFTISTTTKNSPGGYDIQDGGCYAKGGVCISTGGSGSGTVNSGVFGQMAFYGANGTTVSGTTTIVVGTTTADANNVGIGTTSPWGNLSVSDFTQTNLQNPAFVVASTTNAVSFIVLKNGNTGVGTTSPGTKFGVNGNSVISGTENVGSIVTASRFIATTTTLASVLPLASTTAVSASTEVSAGIAGGNQKAQLVTTYLGDGFPHLIFSDLSGSPRKAFIDFINVAGANTEAQWSGEDHGGFALGQYFRSGNFSGSQNPPLRDMFELTGEQATVLVGTSTCSSSCTNNFNTWFGVLAPSWSNLSRSGAYHTNIFEFSSSTSATDATYNDLLVGTKAGLVGVGTSTPYATLSVQSGSNTGDAFAVATSSGKAVFGIDNDGHKFSSGPAPIVSSCGTGSPTIVGDDQGGTITTGTGATSCTITFSKAYRNTPYVTFIGDNSIVITSSVTTLDTTHAVISVSGAGLTGGLIWYGFGYHQ